MSAQAAFRLLAPITVGSALLGVSLCSRQPETQNLDLTVQPASPEQLTRQNRRTAEKRRSDAVPSIDLNFVRSQNWTDQVSQDSVGLDLTPSDPASIPHIVPRDLVETLFKTSAKTAAAGASDIASRRDVPSDPDIPRYRRKLPQPRP